MKASCVHLRNWMENAIKRESRGLHICSDQYNIISVTSFVPNCKCFLLSPLVSLFIVCLAAHHFCLFISPGDAIWAISHWNIITMNLVSVYWRQKTCLRFSPTILARLFFFTAAGCVVFSPLCSVISVSFTVQRWNELPAYDWRPEYIQSNPS